MEEQRRWQAWRQQRQTELAGPDSWFGLLGLFWLEPGLNTLGSDPACSVRLQAGPTHWGRLDWQGESLRWQDAASTEQVLQSDIVGTPTVVESGALAFFVVDREGRLAVRLRDRAWADTREFHGVASYDYDPNWQIEATWETLEPPLTMEVPNVSGELKTVTVDHQAVFQVGGERINLLPMSVSDKEVFFVFRDRTSGRETYGAGRFLKVPPAVDRKIRLNFNFAYNPPCAFTPFATCPLPPPENWLPFAIPAGERKWVEGDESGLVETETGT